MFMVTQILLFIFELFPDAKVLKDIAQDFVGVDLTGDRAEVV